MLSPLDFLSDLTNPLLSFLPKALLVAVVCSVVAGVIGSHVVLRGMAFIGDAGAHSVFPGLAVAFLMQGSLLLGGSIAGLTTAILVAVVSQNRRLKEDSVIGILFVGAFALGIVDRWPHLVRRVLRPRGLEHVPASASGAQPASRRPSCSLF